MDALAAQAIDVDHFCSSSRWCVPAHSAFCPTAPISVWRSDDTVVTMARLQSGAIGEYLAPLEPAWGLASPFLTRDVRRGPAELVEALESFRPWGAALIIGLLEPGNLVLETASALSERWRVQRAAPVTRYAASLAGGVDGYLGRRSRKHRAGLRRDARAAGDAGITFETHHVVAASDVAPLLARVNRVEERSWKTREGSSAGTEPMRSFTRMVLQRSAPRGGVLFVLARRDGRDIGYLHGALDGAYFRGIQMSFDDTYRSLGLGNVLQLQTIEWLCELGIQTYDLGSELTYKARWAEERMTTAGLLVIA